MSSTSKKDHFNYLHSKVQKELCMMQDNWWMHKGEEVQHCADMHNSKQFFSAIKAVYGILKHNDTPSSHPMVQPCWRTKVASPTGREKTLPFSSTDPVVLDQISQNPTIDEADLPTNIGWDQESDQPDHCWQSVRKGWTFCRALKGSRTQNCPGFAWHQQ